MRKSKLSLSNKVTVLSDPHAHNFQKFAKIKDGFNTRLLDVIRALRFINTYNEENGIEDVICAGDIFNTFSYVEGDVLNMVDEVLSSWYGHFYYVAGNHDLKTKISKYDDRLAISKIFSGKSHMHLLNGGSIESVGFDKSLFGMGWQDPNNFYKQEFKPADIFVGHQMIDHPDFPKGMMIHQDWVEQNGYKLVIFGDIHSPLFRKYDKYNVLIPGAPLQHNFGDAGQERGFWVADLDTFDAEFIAINNTPKFIKVANIEQFDKNDTFNFYRIDKPAGQFVDTADANVMLRKEADHAFRESGLLVSMTDEALLNKYIEIKGEVLPADELLPVGLKYLKGCESSAAVPKDFKITKVVINNFLSFQGEHTFKIIQDIFLVLGSNGSGKTSVWEAIYWCLFGVTTKGVSADKVVNDTVLKNCSVQVFLESKGSNLVVSRFRKHDEQDNAFFFDVCDDTGILATVKRESVDATQEELNMVLGTNESFFKNVNYFSQEDFEFFSTLTDAGQKAVCKNLMQIDRFEKAEAKIKFELAGLNDKYEKLEQTISTDKALLIEKSQHITQMRNEGILWEQQRQENIKTLEDTLAVLTERSEKVEKKIAVLDEEKADLVEQKKVFRIDIPEFVDEFAPVIADLEKKITVAEDERRNGRQQHMEATKKYNTEKDSLNKSLMGIVADIRQINTRLDDIKVQSKDADKALCTHCNQKLPPLKVTELKLRLESEHQEKSKLLPDINRRKQEIENRIQEIDEALSLLEVGNDYDKQDQAIRIQQVKKAATVDQRNAAVVAYNALAEEARTKYNEQVHDIELQQNTLEQNLILCYSERKDVQLGISNNARDKKIIEEAANPLTILADRFEDEKKALILIVEDLEKDLTELSRQQDIYRFWRVAFSNQGIVSFLLDSFAKDFTNEMNDVLLDVTNGRYSAVLSTQKKLKGKDEYKEQFEFKIFIEGKERSYKALSGGQKARVNLATVIALNRIIQKQYKLYSVPFGLVVLDEIVSELDAEGIESMNSLITDFSKNCAVYVITHMDNFKSMFSNYVSVDYDKESGTVLRYEEEAA